ncbi:fam-l protein [Plasmodium brasilianum]|uniref:Fam-l protein n=2 Tax=Plasmodium (Plasmodium) TaxID=418103 RepID=A0ACB9YE26_PLABR|nr:fam-l protein [Plasmodium brasilianum]
MEQNIKLLFFTTLSSFIILSWIRHFYNDMSTFNKYLNENYNPYEKKDIKTYRLLGKCKQDHISSIVGLKSVIPNNELKDKKNISNSQKEDKYKYVQLDESSMNSMGHQKQAKKNKSYIFETKDYSYLEKKIFKELDFFDFLKNNRTISDNLYKKVVLKKRQLRIFTPAILLILLSISLILDFCCGYGLRRGLFKLLKFSLGDGPLGKLYTFLEKYFVSFFKIDIGGGKSLRITPFFDFLIYFSSFVILGITLILGVLYYHKKVKKYEKIKYKKK